MLWAAGLVAMIPVAIWFARDLSRIPSRTWYWAGYHRRPWQWAVLLGWAAGGWPGMVVVLVWSQSAVRSELFAELDAERAEYHSSH